MLVPYEKKEKKDNPKQMGSSKIGRDIGYIPQGQENASFTVWTWLKI